jgi:hypothetical protein
MSSLPSPLRLSSIHEAIVSQSTYWNNHASFFHFTFISFPGENFSAKQIQLSEDINVFPDFIQFPVFHFLGGVNDVDLVL